MIPPFTAITSSRSASDKAGIYTRGSPARPKRPNDQQWVRLVHTSRPLLIMCTIHRKPAIVQKRHLIWITGVEGRELLRLAGLLVKRSTVGGRGLGATSREQARACTVGGGAGAGADGQLVTSNHGQWEATDGRCKTDDNLASLVLISWRDSMGDRRLGYQLEGVSLL